jgi:hypothetical protein
MSYGSAFGLSRSFENQTGSRRKLVITQKSVVITDVNNTRGEVKGGVARSLQDERHALRCPQQQEAFQGELA